jgi:ABC-2 type transport system ATP-binding protein
MDHHTDLITVQNLRRRYGSARGRGFEAVRGVDFSVRRGELFALLGTNGAGKTSVLEVVEGLAQPTSGAVHVLGLDPYRRRRLVRPRTGIMLQAGGLAGELTVGETVRMWAGTLTAPRPALEALELVDLRSRAKVTVRQLSGGERRRLDLALAILGNPEILFLDEPTAGLEPESRVGAWRLLRELLATGTTVVLTTHYLAEAEELADRLVILHQGRVVKAGTPAEVVGAEPARIWCTLPWGTSELIPPLPFAVRYDTGGAGSVVITTTDLQHTMAALMEWAAARGVVFEALSARPATLEEAFLGVAGYRPASSDQDAA